MFGILDIIWSALKLIAGSLLLITLEPLVRVLAIIYIVDAVLSTVFASLLVHGARKMRHRLLFAYIVFQVSISVILCFS